MELWHPFSPMRFHGMSTEQSMSRINLGSFRSISNCRRPNVGLITDTVSEKFISFDSIIFESCDFNLRTITQQNYTKSINEEILSKNYRDYKQRSFWKCNFL